MSRWCGAASGDDRDASRLTGTQSPPPSGMHEDPAPEQMDGLRRSKRNKFHLDVVAAVSGVGNPDKRRSHLDAKYMSKEANHAVHPRRSKPAKPPSTPAALPALLAPSTPDSAPAADSTLPEKIESSAPDKSTTITLRNSRVENKGQPAESKPSSAPNAKSAIARVSQVKPSTKSTSLPAPSPTLECEQCHNVFRSKSGLSVHKKHCRQHGTKRHQNKDRGSIGKVKANKVHSSAGIRQNKSSSRSMPVLIPEGALEVKKCQKKRAGQKRTHSPDLDPLPQIKKFNLPSLPSLLIPSVAARGLTEFQCEECPFKTFDRILYRFHRPMHVGERTYKCSLCTYSCMSPDSLHMHLALHLPDLSPKTAALIQKCIAKKRMTTWPVESIPPDAENVMYCSQCSYRTLMKDRFQQHCVEHIQGHQRRLASLIKRTAAQQQNEPEPAMKGPSKKLFTCNRCDFKVDSCDMLAHHTEFHGSGSIYVCQFCDYASDDKTVSDFHSRHHHDQGCLTDHLNKARNSYKQTGLLLTPDSLPPNTPQKTNETN